MVVDLLKIKNRVYSGACRGVELSLLLFVLGGKFTELILNKQEKLKIKIHIFEKCKKVFNVAAKIHDISQIPCGENVEYFGRFY